jgi:hypothetical protein
VPITSGSEPAAVATTGVPHAIASAAGRPKPSKSDGTATSAARRYRPTSVSTARARPRRRDRRSRACARAGAPGLSGCGSSTSVSRVGRGSAAIASTSVGTPLFGSLARPTHSTSCGSRATAGSGQNRSVSTPFATMRIRSRATPKSRSIWRALTSDEVNRRSTRRATNDCIPTG